MSNTSTVTPYATRATGTSGADVIGAGIAGACVAGAAVAAVAAACVVGTVAGAVALARWLAEETPEDRAAMGCLQEERRCERLRNRMAAADLASTRRESLHFTTVDLHLRNPESLIHAAEKLGYHREPLIQLPTPLAEQSPVLLSRASGERLAIGRSASGRLVVCTAGDRHRVQTLVHQYTLDRAIEHLANKGMGVQTMVLPNGEVQIRARERDTGRRGGAAQVKAQVRTDGTAWVDVDCVRGNRCENIVSELAQAIGGEVSSMMKKDAYFQLPGEPTKTRVKV